ncbi:hypothetical protein L1987_82093 [Smallanthus sonchifolius]|uniref:Uncharacterized protein n=1 Tax=Smallanthus sonchifolius TaxID=185202 RepID=A0ACB8YT02_9ASTR|nr:hypothetical protein L1987_82093 [Smallanthus sonchifolius]
MDQIHDPGPVLRSGFKAFKEETEFAITLRKEELLNHNNCTWLSIGNASSPSSCYKDYGLFGYMDLKIDAWFISLLSTPSPTSDALLNTKVAFFDGSRVNPMEEASLILDQTKVLDDDVVFQESLEEEVVSWLQNESYGQKLDKKSKSKLACFEYDSATPVNYSVSSFTDSSDEHSLFSSSSSSDHSSEIMDLEEINTDQPLFWPFNPASDWCSEYKWDFFMSPCKKAGNSEADFEDTTIKTPSSEWDLFIMSPEISSETHGNVNLEKGCNRRLEFSIDSTDVAKSRNVVATEQPGVDRLTKKDVGKQKILLEDLLLVDKLHVEGVLEQVLGLGEFDGHEGIESEFNKDDFSLF